MSRPLHQLRPITTVPTDTTLMVHGMEDGWRTWSLLADHLPAHLDLWAIDAPWCAGNDYSWRYRQQPPDVLEEAVAAMEQPPRFVIAHSFGANATLELLGRGGLPEVRAVVLIAPFYCPPELDITWKLFDQSRRSFEQQIGDGLMARLRTAGRPVSDEIFGRMLDKTMDRIGPSGFLTMFDNFVSSSCVDLDAVDVPVLVMGGASDPCLSNGRAESLAGRANDVTLHVVDAFDHYPHIRLASAVGTLIDEFLTAAAMPGLAERNA